LAVLRSVIAGCVAVLATATARAADEPTGVELGLRTGYAVPFGSTISVTQRFAPRPFRDVIEGAVPIWAGVGYRFRPNLYAGAYFQYGAGVINGDATRCSLPAVICSVSDVVFGVEAHYHFRPDGPIDPWVGIGAAYETLNFLASEQRTGSSTITRASGFQYLNLQIGADYKAMTRLGLGPFVQFGLGQFTSCTMNGTGSPLTCTVQQAPIHEWLTFGLRAAFDVHFGH
jgi:hypothetical protein